MKLYQIDSFTNKIFSGNPAGVCIVDRDIDEEEMQSIALEMNLSETAFVRIYDSHCNLRWFTPASEVPLCGHATLATAFVLWSENYWPKEKTIEFSTLSGPLYTTLNTDGSISMDFPTKEPVLETNFDKTTLEVEMGGSINEVLTVAGELILILDDPEVLRKVRPNSVVIREQAKNGVIVSALSDDRDYDFISRYFAPNLGIEEDPVTGFIHTILTPYWYSKLGKTNFSARQASYRGGTLTTELKGDRVILTGHAIKFFETEID